MASRWVGSLRRSPGGEWEEKPGRRDAENCLDGQGGGCRWGEREGRADPQGRKSPAKRGDGAERGTGEGEVTDCKTETRSQR